MSGVAYIGVGSNIQAYENCLRGIGLVIEDEGVEFLALSSLYRTSPVSPIAQDDFINCALKIRWRASPFDLLSLLHGVERQMARVRGVPLGPRTLDLDILLFDDLLLDTPELTIPHPRLHERKFALIPCLEIDPDLIHPRLGRSLSQFLDDLGDDQAIELVGKPPIDEISNLRRSAGEPSFPHLNRAGSAESQGDEGR
jgi:2-amino-4-hydroxy-6-hydroxymethyldihydropteridine diphosphokinase